jgi:hypothetical protein
VYKRAYTWFLPVLATINDDYHSPGNLLDARQRADLARGERLPAGVGHTALPGEKPSQRQPGRIMDSPANGTSATMSIGI